LVIMPHGAGYNKYLKQRNKETKKQRNKETTGGGRFTGSPPSSFSTAGGRWPRGSCCPTPSSSTG
jgi:hypothetical protein